jgi:hypothetical protein
VDHDQRIPVQLAAQRIDVEQAGPDVVVDHRLELREIDDQGVARIRGVAAIQAHPQPGDAGLGQGRRHQVGRFDEAGRLHAFAEHERPEPQVGHRIGTAARQVIAELDLEPAHVSGSDLGPDIGHHLGHVLVGVDADRPRPALEDFGGTGDVVRVRADDGHHRPIERRAEGFDGFGHLFIALARVDQDRALVAEHQRDVAQPEADRAPDPVVDLVRFRAEFLGMGEIGGMRNGALAADGRLDGFHGVLSRREPPAGWA